MYLLKQIIFLSLLLQLHGLCSGQQLAFPGAEGYGKFSVGGRGGAVLEVTNLADHGEGSLRAAVEATGPRTIIFRVSGTITLESPLLIANPYLTIAGQTAPGDGICIRKHPLIIEADHVIIRYIRVRLGDESGEDTDAVSARYVKNLIIDHVSASWSIDETMSVYHCDSITVQWCIISESLYHSNHAKGSHGFGGIWGGNHSTYHHNLVAHHSSRNPRFASGSGFTDYRNNVIYNWGYNSCYGGEKKQRGRPEFDTTVINMVANYYKPGPATQPGEVLHRIASPSSREQGKGYGRWYVTDNEVDGFPEVLQDNWSNGVHPQHGMNYIDQIRMEHPWPSMPIEMHSAEQAYQKVLKFAGARWPKRDPVDERIIRETRLGSATFEGMTYEVERTVADPSSICGIIDSQADAGGWPALKSLPAPADTDHDGMPDEWEDAHNLDKENPADRNWYAPDGYTMLERYINSILPEE